MDFLWGGLKQSEESLDVTPINIKIVVSIILENGNNRKTN